MVIVRYVPDGERAAQRERLHILKCVGDDDEWERQQKVWRQLLVFRGKVKSKEGKVFNALWCTEIRRTASFGLFRSTPSSCSLAVVINFSSRFFAVFSAASTQILPQQVSEQEEEGKTPFITVLLLFYTNTGFIEDLWCQNENKRSTEIK